MLRNTCKFLRQSGISTTTAVLPVRCARNIEDSELITRRTVSAVSGEPMEFLDKQVHLVYDGKQPMHNLDTLTKVWRIEFPGKSRWRNPLMGWRSANDSTREQLKVSFETFEQAEQYCKQNGMDYTVQDYTGKKEPIQVCDRSYSDNFTYRRPEKNLYDD